MLEGSISLQQPTNGRSPDFHSTLPPSIRKDEAQEGLVPGRESLGVTVQGLNVGQAVLVIRDCMLECTKLNPGMSTPQEPGKLPGLREAEGVCLACRHLDVWALTPWQSACGLWRYATQPEDQLCGGTGSVCAHTQGMRLERGPLKGESKKTDLAPWDDGF